MTVSLPGYSAETFEQVRERLNTPGKIGYFLKHDLKYVYVKEATPYRSAEEVFRSRSGGCTDYANFAYEMLVYHGYTAGIYEMWNDRRGHAFVVYLNRDGNYSSIESIYGQMSWNYTTAGQVGQSIYKAYGGYTGIKYVKGFHKFNLLK